MITPKVELPEMTVELRVSTTAHNVPAPNLSTDNLCSELSKTLMMNQDAKSNSVSWPLSTLDILVDTCKLETPPSYNEIVTSIKKVCKFNNWADTSKFVVDDMCLDFFNMGLRYLLATNTPHVEDLDFIDGSGIGYAKFYTERLKVTLEKAFDAKYYYKVKRPLVYAIEDKKINLSEIANAIHPGHWSYPAGHGTKFFTVVEVLNDIFILSDSKYREIFIAAHVCAMGRSGNLIHFPMDNDAGAYLTSLTEYKN